MRGIIEFPETSESLSVTSFNQWCYSGGIGDDRGEERLSIDGQNYWSESPGICWAPMKKDLLRFLVFSTAWVSLHLTGESLFALSFVCSEYLRSFLSVTF